MRDLTEEELKLAPEWATHYFIYMNGDVLFESTKLYQYYSRLNGFHSVLPQGEMLGKSREINKPFDITQHEWSDIAVFDCEKSCDVLLVYISDSEQLTLSKDDAIAIANALGVTMEDLK